ncbi:MAG: PhzF family phenazine biosynthesis protein [Synergistaceae bacterium]|jgi:PhzF family phenazine biosynthesis protein|nr:PhzF family phenazine biosynthesis protein [Synergistaceae bacterium]
MKCYIVDAFAEKVFEGNQAGVCVLDAWLPDTLMLNIAGENNLSETAFAVKEDGNYGLRWFTPGGEIDLCGHATLATAFVLARYHNPASEEFRFKTKSGILTVRRRDDLFEMELPAYELTSVPVTDEMTQAIGYRPVEAWMGRDLVCVLENEKQIYDAEPNQTKILALDGLLLQITAKGTQYDCVTRSFAPKLGVSEDPVCGSGHCHVIPLWAKKLDKKNLVARQASRRGGTLLCENCGDRVKLSGKAVLYAMTELFVE